MSPLVISCSFQLNIPPKKELSLRETLFANASLHLDEFMGFAAFAHPQASPNRGVRPSFLSFVLCAFG